MSKKPVVKKTKSPMKKEVKIDLFKSLKKKLEERLGQIGVFYQKYETNVESYGIFLSVDQIKGLIKLIGEKK